ncbi:8576_t:CDS:2, partial [Funneliformis caledonium]
MSLGSLLNFDKLFKFENARKVSVSSSNKGRARSSSTSGGSGGKTVATPPVLGGLFASGMPKLKSRGGIDTGRDNNNLAAPPPLPGGRPRAPSDGKQVSVAVPTVPQSKGEAQLPFRNTIQKSIGKTINSETTSPSLPNRTPPLPTRAKTNAVPPQLPNRTPTSNSTSSLPPLPSRNTKSATPPLPSVKKVPPPTPNKPSSLASNKSAPPRPVSTMQQSQSPSLQPPHPPRARSPGFVKSIPSQKEPPTTEGRWTFHSSSEFPTPRPFIKLIREYPSGASTISLDLSSLTLQGTPQRAPPPPPL